VLEELFVVLVALPVSEDRGALTDVLTGEPAVGERRFEFASCFDAELGLPLVDRLLDGGDLSRSSSRVWSLMSPVTSVKYRIW
jgi:hypothetical protein